MLNKLLRRFGLVVVLLAIPAFAVAAPLYYTTAATQNSTPTTLTIQTSGGVAFIPQTFILYNDDTANSIWIRPDGGTAASGDGNGSFEVKPGDKYHGYSFGIDNGPATVSIVCAAAQTAHYRVEAFR